MQMEKIDNRFYISISNHFKPFITRILYYKLKFKVQKKLKHADGHTQKQGGGAEFGKLDSNSKCLSNFKKKRCGVDRAGSEQVQ
jgi:hypothetical protein